MFMELQDGDVSEMSDLSDSGDDESDSQYLLLNSELTDFYDLTQLEPMYLHFNDNSKFKPKNDPGHDLFKVRPTVDLLSENLIRTESEERQSINEQIIPFKEWIYGHHDGYKHFPEFGKDQKRCRICQRNTKILCSKCLGIVLCLVPKRNCFLSYHRR
ncbi:hypothetical protein QYM36_017098 [Artemia franciscana]|uniref:PiggyBac transposable element-derived protein domain-containing protein n=1 Tax=Artemia franciscana TaxID=6661 RepID=A0AA88HGP1_ARTSF|nr:hypothetical protein QYM36_017098 [Artemia franciscana]